MQDRFKQPAAFGLGGGKLRLQMVAERDELVYFSDNAALLRDGGNGNDEVSKRLEGHCRLRGSSLALSCLVIRSGLTSTPLG